MSTNRGGSVGFDGYLYQVLVSVWFAVDVLLVHKKAECIELEPASQEDLEADLLDARRPVAGAVLTAATHTLRVQVKSSPNEPWDIKRFRELMLHGGPRRGSALKQLSEDLTAKYLLITNGVALNLMSQLRVTSIGDWPERGNLPPVSDDRDSESTRKISERVGVLDNHTEEILKWKLRDQLTREAHVPLSRLDQCIKTLYLDAQQRMRPLGGRVWRKSDLEETIKQHGGYLADSREDAEYVKPKNWHQMLNTLNQQHAIIIIGQSGTGKTSAAQTLISKLRELVPGIEEVQATTPRSVRQCRIRPVVFYLDDPWGKSRFEQNAESWRRELPSILQHAGADCFFVVTTRRDVYESAGHGDSHQRWLFPLENSDYEPRDRNAMYRNRLRKVQPQFLVAASDWRGRVLSELKSPYEIDQFFSNLNGLIPADSAQDRWTQMENAKSRAHIECIQDNIRLQVTALNASVPAIVLWSVLTVTDRLGCELLRKVHTRMAKIGRDYRSMNLDELVNFLSAGKSLRSVGDVISYGHPQVRAALRQFVEHSPLISHEVLQAVSLALWEQDDSAGKAWSAEALARLSAALPRAIDKHEVFKGEIADVMNNWLQQQCLDEDISFEDPLALLARAGMPDFVPAEVARLVRERCVYSPFLMDGFEAYAPNEAWLAAAASHPSTKTLCHRFVAEVLPFGFDLIQDNLFDILKTISGDLTQVCLRALSASINSDERCSHTTALLHAVDNDIDGLRVVAQEALTHYRQTDTSISAEDSLAIEDFYYGDDYAADLGISTWESIQVAEEILTRFARVSREKHGWRAFSEESKSLDMDEWWLDVAKNSQAEEVRSDEAEIECLWSRVRDTELESAFWDAADTWQWTAQMQANLLGRLLARDGIKTVRDSAVSCALRHDSGSVLVEAAAQLAARRSWSQLLDLLSEVEWHMDWRVDDELLEVTEKMLLAVPFPQGRMLHAVLESSPSSDANAFSMRVFLEELSPKLEKAILALVQAKNARSIETKGLVKLVLQTCNQGGPSAEALEVSASEFTDAELLELTEHRYGKVRAAALKALARSSTVTPALLLNLSRDRSSYVKEVVVTLASAQPGQYKDVLQAFLLDTWTGDSWANGSDACMPFARRAAKALTSISQLAGDDERTYLSAGLEAIDSDVRLQLLKHVVAHGTTESRELLLVRSMSSAPGQGRSEAALALASEVASVSPETASAIVGERLIELDADIAVLLAKVAGARLELARAIECAEVLQADPERRILLLPFGVGAKHRKELMGPVVGMLPSSSPALRVFEPAPADIPTDCLVNLGGHEEVEAVRRALKRWFKEPAK